MAAKSIEIGLWKLSRQDNSMADEWSAVVIAAPSEKSARETANASSKAEGYVWTDSGRVNAQYLGVATEGISGIILWTSEEGE